MAGYQVSITNSEGSIEFSSSEEGSENSAVTITEVNFRMNTIDDNVQNHSDAVRAEFEIKGKINDKNKSNTLKLLKWSIDNDQKTLFRDVEVVVYVSENATGAILRRYQVKQMFVIDYEESNGDKAEGLFRLFIAQKKGNREIKIYDT